MKGLLLKDFYMLQTSGRTSVFILGLFMVLSIFSDKTTFFFNFIALFASLIPLSFLGIDEKDKWTEYSLALPYSKNDIVSSTYIFNLIMTMVIALLCLGLYILKNLKNPMLITASEIQSLSFSLILVGLTPAILIYPITFWLGSDKGRLVYMGLMGILYILFFSLSGLLSALPSFKIDIPLEILVLAAFLLLYVGAWRLSIYLYGKRMEIL